MERERDNPGMESGIVGTFMEFNANSGRYLWNLISTTLNPLIIFVESDQRPKII
jgi:hypothetical protein